MLFSNWAAPLPNPLPTRSSRGEGIGLALVGAALADRAASFGSVTGSDTPSPPSDGGEGRGEEARLFRMIHRGFGLVGAGIILSGSGGTNR